ncbi:MAG: 3-phosphoserine/phosphohydroxythreonine transaminase [Candidatus Cloacimonas acidaminovorans]|jgi:phosphoserine aminotransferase|nr:3-phosphoserine/phosphohydroxythreonine transaminase [Candidatus Cloacimonas acidaminovorans]HOS07160.1 3-phosphoserine/phosphohydroxythreonine transaminase [Candidatus Cloacimonas acidaminovorans]HOT38586.1 3-phosphoserine/phosphohydroxythreonine transaminase [Candidatus Cloacimonas acidaminovorans]HPL51542.1 3-phosphoserine/phosphohydroxythreonine transaminase [Candidatus Cloacimonas acidaminovorans]HQF35136.1 3-phosphoserine/phosphohydroxythreonine transaminase [Candidatus Cloacimonas aci
MERVHNFNAGPAVLPEEVLREAQADLVNYKGMGLSVMEMSHRSKEFEAIINEARDAAKRIYGLGDDWDVLFLHGGASLQFVMVPMNFLPEGKIANFIHTGVWSKKAMAEVKKLGKPVHIAASSEDKSFSYIPKTYQLSDNPAYLHITTNNTIYGTEWKIDPDVPKDVPLIADMSSNFMSKPIDINKYSFIYAGAQKNIGPAGCAVILVKKDFLATGATNLPSMLDYQLHAKNGSLYNTPPCFTIYMIGLVLKWIENYGGLAKIEENNKAKAKYIYDVIDASNGFYRGTVVPEDRSLMNITFRLPSEELENLFISEAKKNGMIGLKGHRDVGGCRASCYNALPLNAAYDLAEFMKNFQKQNG